MRSILQLLALSVLLLAANGCSEPALPKKECFYTKLPYIKYRTDRGSFEVPKDVNATHSIYKNSDVYALHDSKEYYKSECWKTNRVRKKLNRLWGYGK